MLTVLDPAGVPVSSVLSFYFRDEVLPYYAGDDARARALAANDFKYWELMRRAWSAASRCSTTVAPSVDTGSFAFKKNWGFEPQPLHYEYCLLKRDSIPQNNPSNPKYRAFIEVWRRLPRPRGQRARALRSCAIWDDRDDGAAPLSGPSDPVSAEQGRQDPLLPSAAASAATICGSPRYVRRRPGRWAHVATAPRLCALTPHVETLDPHRRAWRESPA